MRFGLIGRDSCSTKWKRFAAAQAAADAAGVPVQDCWGHADFYVSPGPFIGSVTEGFHFGDVELNEYRSSNPLVTPASNPVVTFVDLVVQGIHAIGFENDHPGGTVRVGSSTYGTSVRSQILWQEQGMDYAITSVSAWSLKRLAELANSCAIVQPSPEPRFPTNQVLPPNQLTSVDWNQPLEVNTPIDPSAALAGVQGAFLPKLGTPVAAFSEGFGSSRHASHLIVFLYDIPNAGRVLVYEYPAQMSPEEFARSIVSMSRIKGPLGSTGYYKVSSIRGGFPAFISVANGGAPSTLEWLENGIDVMLAAKSPGEKGLLDLAARL